MKKILLILILIVTNITYGQIDVISLEKPITIGKIAPMGQLNIGIEKYENDNEYVVTYRDIKFSKIMEYKSFRFKDQNDDFNKLYKLIIDGLNTLPDDQVVLNLPNDIVYLKFEKFLGSPVVSFYTSVNKTNIMGVSSQLTKKQIDKLFGKNK